MNFSECKNDIRSGDLIAFTHHGWDSLKDFESQMVRVFTESEYSHVCVAHVEGDEVYVIEAVVPLVKKSLLSERLEVGAYWIPTSVPMSDDEAKFGLSEVGVGQYSKIEAIEGELGTLDIGADDKWECAELTIAMRRKSGLDLGPKATPAAVVQKALELGYPLKFIKEQGNG